MGRGGTIAPIGAMGALGAGTIGEGCRVVVGAVVGIGAIGLGWMGCTVAGGIAGAGEAGLVGKLTGGVVAPGLARAAAKSWSIAVIRLTLDVGWSGMDLEIIYFDLILLLLSSREKQKVVY